MGYCVDVELQIEGGCKMYSISVIIPVYNNEDTIIDALESVKKQVALDKIVDIIVVNDGSKDSSKQLINDFITANPCLPIELVEQENKGASAARNEGLKRAKGNWIAFLDADDEWLENRLSRQIEVIDNNPDIDFLGAAYNNQTLRILGRKIDKLYKANVSDLVIKYFPCTPSILMRKRIYDEIGGFNESWKYAEDGEYYTRICLKYNYYYLPEQLVVIGHGKRTFGEKGLSSNLSGMFEGNINIIKRLRNSNDISTCFYVFLIVFYYLKYFRRLIITYVSKVVSGK